MSRLSFVNFRLLLAIVLASFVPFAAIERAEARTVVSAPFVKRGEIVVRTGQRRLYFGVGQGRAIVYRVGVGRQGRQWTGRARIVRKVRRPAWKPTKMILRDKPHLRTVPGGSPRNPMGAAALVLNKGQYAIHGTNNPRSIGGFVSYGCIRMHNADIMDLYARVGWRTKVTVTR